MTVSKLVGDFQTFGDKKSRLESPGWCLKPTPGWKNIHHWKLTWHWKITIFTGKYTFKWWIFHCPVSFRGGYSGQLEKFSPPQVQTASSYPVPRPRARIRAWERHREKPNPRIVLLNTACHHFFRRKIRIRNTPIQFSLGFQCRKINTSHMVYFKHAQKTTMKTMFSTLLKTFTKQKPFEQKAT